jgi:hypothetical protein
MSRTPRTLVALALGVTSTGCIDTFDSALFMRDVGVDATAPDAPTMDAFERDAAADPDAFVVLDAPALDAPALDAASDAPPSDGGPPLFSVADYCTTAPELVLSGASRTIAIDTRGLVDDGSADIAMCLGTAPVGPDGFFRIHSAAGQRWHFHFRHVGEIGRAHV